MLKYFAFFVICCGIAISGHTLDTKQTTIGVSIALTGPVSVVGETLKNAIIMADQEYDSENKVKFLFEDDGFLPKNTVSNVNKFISQDKVDALIVFGASTSLSVAGIAEKNKIPMAGLTVLETLERDKNYIVRFFASTADLNARTVKEFEKRQLKTTALVATIQDATLLQRDHFIESKVSKVVLSQEFLPGDLDFRATVTRVKSLNPEAVYVIMLPPQGSTFVKQLRAGGYTGQIIGSLQLAAPAEIESSEGALEGAWVATGNDRQAEHFFTGYEKLFPKSKAFTESVYAYDLGKMMIEGAQSGEINKYLHTVRNFHGALGAYGADGKNCFDFGVSGKIITKGGFRYSD